MSARVLRLGPGECSDIESGARYFAALAFPGVGEQRARLDAERGWVGAYLHNANRIEGRDDPFEDEQLNKFVQRSPAWCKARVRTGHRRLRDRSDAARAVRPWMTDLLGHPHGPVSGVGKFTQRQIALYLCDNDLERAANFQQRVWRPSRPVLHAAIANELSVPPEGKERVEMGLELASATAVCKLVNQARMIGALIIRDPRFGLCEENLLHLEWVP